MLCGRETETRSHSPAVVPCLLTCDLLANRFTFGAELRFQFGRPPYYATPPSDGATECPPAATPAGTGRRDLHHHPRVKLKSLDAEVYLRDQLDRVAGHHISGITALLRQNIGQVP